MGLSLDKGQKLSLSKDNGSALTKIIAGLGWDPVKKRGLFGGGGEIDLDASVIMFDSNKNALDTVSFSKLNSSDGSVRHSGDNLTGAGDGDDEQIVVDLTRVNPAVQSLVFVITSYSGQKFSQIENVFCRVVDASAGNKEVVRYDLKGAGAGGNNTAQIMAKVSRSASGWEFVAVGEAANGRTASKVLADAQRVA